MKTLKPLRRSVSPFGQLTQPPSHPYIDLENFLKEKFPATGSKKLNQLSDLGNLPDILNHLSSHDGAELIQVCEFLIQHRDAIIEQQCSDAIAQAMEIHFTSRIDDFLISHHDRAACEKMEWSDEYRDVIMGAKERDYLVGRFFAEFTEPSPGQFSGFLSRWIQSERPDHLVHFLDFCRGSNNPTFEYFLVFSNPSFHRILSNKALIKGLLHKCEGFIKRLSSPTWKNDVCAALSL